MSNVFQSDVHKVFFKQGVQDELRDGLPMAYVSDVDTENAEFIVNRFGSDITAQSTPNSIYRRATGFTYDKDKKSIDEIATATDEILYQELMREGFDVVADRQDKHAYALEKAIHRHGVHTTRIGAGSQLDNEVLAGTTSAGTPITMSSSNPDDVSATIVQILQEGNAYGSGNPYVMMTPKDAKFYNLFSMAAGFGTADKALVNGIFTRGGTRIIRGAQGFAGLDVIVTNEMETSVVVTLTDETDAGDTVVIAVAGGTVTLTCDATPNGAGDYDQGGAGDEEATIDNIVALINNSENTLASTLSTSGDYYELTQANRTILQNAGVKARKLTAGTFEVSAFGSLTVTKTGDETTVGTHRRHMIAGAYNSTALCLPSEGMRVDEKPLAALGGTGVHGYELTSFQMHDAVVWTKNAAKIVDIEVTV